MYTVRPCIPLPNASALVGSAQRIERCSDIGEDHEKVVALTHAQARVARADESSGEEQAVAALGFELTQPVFVEALGAYAGEVRTLFPHGSYVITVAVLPASRGIELGPLRTEVTELPCNASKSRIASLSMPTCDCMAGHYMDGFEEDGQAYCVPCAQGFYNPVAGWALCRPCPSDTTTPSTGATSEDQCVCAPGRFTADPTEPQYCTPCERGTYNDKVNVSSCAPCPPGTTTKLLGASSLVECEACGVNRVAEQEGSRECQSCGLNAGTRDDRTECWCDVGFYASQRGPDGGNSTSNNVAPSTTKVCKACPSGATVSTRNPNLSSKLALIETPTLAQPTTETRRGLFCFSTGRGVWKTHGHGHTRPVHRIDTRGECGWVYACAVRLGQDASAEAVLASERRRGGAASVSVHLLRGRGAVAAGRAVRLRHQVSAEHARPHFGTGAKTTAGCIGRVRHATNQVADMSVGGLWLELGDECSTQCQRGHTGVLCTACEEGFTMQGDACLPCSESSSEQNARIVGACMLGLLVMLLLAWVSTRSD